LRLQKNTGEPTKVASLSPSRAKRCPIGLGKKVTSASFCGEFEKCVTDGRPNLVTISCGKEGRYSNPAKSGPSQTPSSIEEECPDAREESYFKEETG
jgi:hypothetical protein